MQDKASYRLIDGLDQTDSTTKSDIIKLKTDLQVLEGLSPNGTISQPKSDLELSQGVKNHKNSLRKIVKFADESRSVGGDKKGTWQRFFGQIKQLTESKRIALSKQHGGDKESSSKENVLDLTQQDTPNHKGRGSVNASSEKTSSHRNKIVHRSHFLEINSQLADSLPKVALCFLIRGDIPFESTWRIFLENVPLPGQVCR